MKGSIHSGHRIRLRENVRLSGLDNMQPHQVLEYLLSFVIARKDTNPIAHRLIDKFGSLDAVFEAPYHELLNVEGMGEVSATFIHDFIHIYSYYSGCKAKHIHTIDNASTAVIYCQQLMQGKTVEEFYTVLIDSNTNVIGRQKIARGNKTSVNTTMKEVLKYALSNNAAQVVLCHNHPDADSMPSSEDVIFTETVQKALEANEIKMVDHVIVGRDDCYSFYCGYKVTDQMIQEFKKSVGKL